MKSYVCALAEGIMLDFELYQGADALIAGTKWTGFGRFGHWSSVWNSPSWYKCVLLSVLYIHQSCGPYSHSQVNSSRFCQLMLWCLISKA